MIGFEKTFSPFFFPFGLKNLKFQLQYTHLEASKTKNELFDYPAIFFRDVLRISPPPHFKGRKFYAPSKGAKAYFFGCSRHVLNSDTVLRIIFRFERNKEKQLSHRGGGGYVRG